MVQCLYCDSHERFLGDIKVHLTMTVLIVKHPDSSAGVAANFTLTTAP